jgi:nicotinamidase/pyrazinamidase
MIIVDVQNDFLPGGALAVPKGDEVIAELNRYADLFASRQLPVFATRDWHPPNHCSFRERGGPWPPHCVAGTAGAQFAPGLALPPQTRIVAKATSPETDAYSGFAGTELDAMLRQAGVRRVFVGGLATDYCVLNTVKDARSLGYEVVLLRDAVRAVEVQPGDGLRAEQEMTRLGAVPADRQAVGA